MKQGSSSRKVNEQAREAIANILLYDVADPRLLLVTVTACEVSFDRSACNVFYTVDKGRYDEVAQALAGARGHIRSELARTLSWRVAPELRFRLDSTVDAAERIDAVLAADQARYGTAADDAAADDVADDVGATGDEALHGNDSAEDVSCTAGDPSGDLGRAGGADEGL